MSKFNSFLANDIDAFIRYRKDIGILHIPVNTSELFLGFELIFSLQFIRYKSNFNFEKSKKVLTTFGVI
jgi:hypothetical protein